MTASATDIGAGQAAARVRQSATIASVFVGLAVGYPSVFGATSTAFLLPLTAAFGWGRLIPSLMFTCAMFGVSVASLVLGRVMTRFGAPSTAAASSVGLSVALLALSRMTGSVPLALGLAFVAGLLGSGTGIGLYVSVMPPLFVRRLGLALGCAVVGQSVGSILMPSMVVAITAASGWRAAYVGLAAVHLVVTLTVALLLRSLGGGAATARRLDRPTIDMSPAAALRSPTFWTLAVVIFLQTVAMFGMTVHLFPIFADRGVAAAYLPSLLIMVSIGMAVGRLGAGILIDRQDARRVAASLFALGASGIAWLAVAHGATRLDMALPPLLIGLALGGESDILAYLTRRYFGLKHYPVIYNRLLVGFFLGSMTGPVVVGWSFDHLARGPLPLWLLAGSAALAAVGALLLPRVPSLE